MENQNVTLLLQNKIHIVNYIKYFIICSNISKLLKYKLMSLYCKFFFHILFQHFFGSYYASYLTETMYQGLHNKHTYIYGFITKQINSYNKSRDIWTFAYSLNNVYIQQSPKFGEFQPHKQQISIYLHIRSYEILFL